MHHFKAPQFWIQNPKMWFIQFESRFVTANINDDEIKFHLMSARWTPKSSRTS
jgi:hypothetical protein